MNETFGYTFETEDIDGDAIRVTVNGENSTSEFVVIDLDHIDEDGDDAGLYTELTPEAAIRFAQALITASVLAKYNNNDNDDDEDEDIQW